MANEKKEQERKHITASEALGDALYVTHPPETLHHRDFQISWLASRRVVAENAARIAESGVRAAHESNADSTWFQSWAKTALPDLLAQAQLKALTLFEQQREKRENTWSERLRKGFGWLIGGIILAFVSFLLAWALGVVGFR